MNEIERLGSYQRVNGEYQCKRCQGTGQVLMKSSRLPLSIEGLREVDCTECKGSGQQLITITKHDYDVLLSLYNRMLEMTQEGNKEE